MTRSRLIARRHAVTLAAIFALLGQALFPHVHGWHGRGVSPAPDVALTRCTTECPTALSAAAASDTDGDADRHSSTCPLCRAQSDARSSVLPPSFAVPLPAAAAAPVIVDGVFSLAVVVRSLAAPRAPPLAS